MIMNLQKSIGVNMNNNKKNIILILTDQMRGDCLGVNGNDKIMTPFIDDLAKSGMNFENAQAANPSCIPARASILTGLPAEENGFYGYCDKIPWSYKDTMVDRFNSLGYKTINVGKTHFYPQRNDMNFVVNKLYDPQRLDADFISDYHLWLNEQDRTIEDPAIHYDNNGWPVFEWPGKAYYHPTEWTMRTSIEEIEKCNDNPFFMQISFHRPHPPFDPPKYYLDLYRDTNLPDPVEGDWSTKFACIEPTVHGQYGKIDEKYISLAQKAYYASITHIDYQIGRLTEYLQQNKLLDNTVIMFTSDHGEMLGDHNMFRKATPFKGAVHIPFIVRDGVNVGVKSSKLATHIDIMPTLLSYVDPLNSSVTDRAINLVSDSDRDYLIGEHPFDKGWNFVLTAKYKYIWDSVSGEEWCFDAVNDTQEKENIINILPKQKLLSLRKILIKSFKERNLNQFVVDDKLYVGNKLPAFEKVVK